MRLSGMLYGQRKSIVEIILLLGLITVLWRIDDAFVSLVCGILSGILFYRLGDRIAKKGVSKA